MTHFKTIALPATQIEVPKEELYTVATANKAVAPIAQTIQNEAKGGWKLHTYSTVNAVVHRRKGLLERFLGWIPVIGFLFIPKAPDFITPEYYICIFSKEE